MGYVISKPLREGGVVKVKITTIEGSRGFPFESKERSVEEKTLEVVKKNKIYKWIKNGEPINLANKYIKGFSLREYREKNELEEKEEVTLKNFTAEGAFFDGGVNFSYAVFEEKASFLGATFGDGDIHFQGATFKDGNISFDAAIFGNGDVNFYKVNFGDGEFSTFATNFGDGSIYFGGANFGNGDISFFGATFGDGIVSFEDATFGIGNVYFNANFGNGDVSFKANFGEGNVDFRHATFGRGNVSFLGAIFKEGKALFPNLKIQGDWDMRVRKADIIDLSESKIYGNIDFGFHLNKEGSEFTPNVNKLYLVNTKLHGRIYMDYDKFNMPGAINNQDDTTHRQKRDQFRLFKENFRNLGQYDNEDKAYVQFIYHKVRDEASFDNDDSKWAKFIKAIKRPSFIFKWLVYEKIGLYGTSPARVALSMLITLGLFTLAYIPLASTINLPENISPFSGKIINAFYHSVITFLTIGYGHDYINPQILLGRVLSGLEGFAGLFLMSYFTISFVRKVLR